METNFKQQIIDSIGPDSFWNTKEEAAELIAHEIGRKSDSPSELKRKINEFLNKPELLQNVLYYIMLCNLNKDNSVNEENAYWSREYQEHLTLTFKAFPEHGEYIYNCLELGDGSMPLTEYMVNLMEKLSS